MSSPIFKVFQWIFAIIFLSICLIQVNGQIDISDDEWIFRSTGLPDDIKTYATIGNGHVATVMHRDSVFVNGLYNGVRGFSHRARIPTRNNIFVSSASGGQPSGHIYELNVKQGVYREKYVLDDYNIEIRTFAHRFYHTVILSQVYVEPIITTNNNNAAPKAITLIIGNNPGDDSLDIDFDGGSDFPSVDSTLYCGSVQEVEDKAYQGDNKPGVCVMTRKLPVGNVIVDGPTTFTYFTSYARNDAIARNESQVVYNQVLAGNHSQLLDSHTSAWEEIWNEARIEVQGNLNISKVINGAYYYLLTSLPITTPTLNPTGQFFGLSPGSLAFGAHDYSRPDMIERPMDYQGHSFWDTETWMYPPILFFHPDKAQHLLNYRMNNLVAARDRAVKTGYRGARFPWESGFTGREVTPDCCEETRDLQIHISADIMYAVRQYIATTRDLSWLVDKKPEYVTNGCGMVREVADFFASRTCYNENGFYDIKGIMPPDEDNYNNIVNNGYTNVMAGFAIFFAKYAECLCNSSMDAIPENWLEIARSLRFLYDEANDYHPEYEGFNLTNPKEIKQADVVLLGYPVMYEMNETTRANDLRIYEELTRADGPAMTWAMHTIGWLDLDVVENATLMFEKSYTSYTRQPFKTWTEAIYPNSGAHNFITGMGGFLQSIINGYAGLRLHPEEIVFRKPRVLPNSSSLKLVGLKYLGNSLDITINSTATAIFLRSGSPNFPLIVEHHARNDTLVEGQSLVIDTSGDNLIFKMFTSQSTGCPLPEDRIGSNRITPREDSFALSSIHIPTSTVSLIILGLMSTLLHLYK